MDELRMGAAEGIGRLTSGGSGLEALRDRNAQPERRSRCLDCEAPRKDVSPFDAV